MCLRRLRILIHRNRISSSRGRYHQTHDSLLWFVCCFGSDGVETASRLSDLSLQAMDNNIPASGISNKVEESLQELAHGIVLHKVENQKHKFGKKYHVDLQNLSFLRRCQHKKSLFCSRHECDIVDLYDVEEIRTGWNTDNFNRIQASARKKKLPPGIFDEDKCFSFIITATHQTLDLVAPSKEKRDFWIEGLRHLTAICKTLRHEEDYNRWLKEQFRTADKNNDGNLNFKECLAVLCQMNISMDLGHVKNLFDEANFRKIQVDGEDALDPEEFVKFYHSLLMRTDLEAIFKQYTTNKSLIMSPEDLCNFFTKEQKMIKTVEDCKYIIERHEPDDSKIEDYMSINGFVKLLLSKDLAIFSTEHEFVCEDMNQPLSHYFIATSHNTYLIQDQLVGGSSVEGYNRALEQGCRCVELDCWDGPDNEPVVYHGYTFTTKVLFRDILDAIKQSAFKASQYPVILSLENHCSVKQQKRMAEHLTNIFGDYLHTAPVKSQEYELPSPASLARKILIKNKKLSDSPDSKPEESYSDDDEDLPDTGKPRQEKPNPMGDGKLAQELSDLVNYVKAVSFKGFDAAKESWKFYEMCSFSEPKAEDHVNKNGKPFAQHNCRHLSRIYPKGTRTDSSNYDPVQFWNVGCQLVALNYQTYDDPMFLNQAFFTLNGGCGYVLKPEYLRNDPYFNPDYPPPDKYKETLIIKVISGQHIPKPDEEIKGEVIDPYVTIEIRGNPIDEKKENTNYVHNNEPDVKRKSGFNPVWDETFAFPLCLPELAIIIFTVKDECKSGKNVVLGQYAIPYKAMAEGYRHVHLHNDYRQPIVPASIFVHITKEKNSKK